MFRITNIYLVSYVSSTGFGTNIIVLDNVARSNFNQLAAKALAYSLCTEDLAVHPLNFFP